MEFALTIPQNFNYPNVEMLSDITMLHKILNLYMTNFPNCLTRVSCLGCKLFDKSISLRAWSVTQHSYLCISSTLS